jgi:tyrosine-protein kinase Etk/Wzc
VTEISGQAFRDVRIQEGLLSAMIRQYEIARIDEAKDAPLFVQLDAAFPPEKRSKPRRTEMVLLSGFLGLLVGVFVAWLQIKVKKSSQDVHLQALKKAWLS